MSSAPRPCAEARVKVRAAEHDDELGAGAEGVDQVRLVGVVKGRDVDRPHLPDVARRLIPDHEHLALFSEPFSDSAKVSALALY